ncbi:MAG: 16S rRNA (guanine(527)-N(7))-methyltransferase RsmG [Bacteroidales bacterium]|nr:16S rRNA (guanine(527)-N(7))-methyltransferase RsmG [Bacteroidales bacterium]
MQIISKYFKDLSSLQVDQFTQLDALYRENNAQINTISRKDIDNLYERHVLHSLAIAKFVNFKNETTVIDVGTGGGFPGIPLAILFPEVSFTLVDSIAKKLKVVGNVSEALQLKNINIEHNRVENIRKKFDFVVSRAVTAFPEFVALVQNNIKKEMRNSMPNGIIYLKGGDFAEEMKPFKKFVEVAEISNYFDEPFFETKKIVYLPF